MKQGVLLCVLLSLLPGSAISQTNAHFTNPDMLPVLKGTYDPSDYTASITIDDPTMISKAIHMEVSADSMKSILIDFDRFHTRNTGSDTLSDVRGIGAAQRYVLGRFNEYAATSEGRLLTGYFQFDQDVCGMTRHKNVVAMLPGRDTSNPQTIIIEAHMDSRCDVSCDTSCLAKGMEDNASGTALVMDLARVMSRFTFNHTILFMATTGEEQGLVGANALSDYLLAQNVRIKAVLNNDIVGGIICGETSSPPSCPGFNHIDSTQVRLFSFGAFNSPHKALARWIKLQYQEMILPDAMVPMLITVMSAEDRTGRGGDHIPFRENGFAAMRFTSANEHGNANASDPDYHDRQHTSGDLLGEDTDGDLVIDSFFVDFNYLARNTVINGNAAAMAALGPKAPAIASVGQDGDYLYIEIDDPNDYNRYVVGLRVHTNDFDTLYYIEGSKTGIFELPAREFQLFISAAAMDADDVESLFSPERLVTLTGTDGEPVQKPVQLFQNKPNPFDEATTISFWVDETTAVKDARIIINDMNGKLIQEMKVTVTQGMNEVLYTHGYNMVGTYLYSLVLNGKVVDTKKMVFSN